MCFLAPIINVGTTHIRVVPNIFFAAALILFVANWLQHVTTTDIYHTIRGLLPHGNRPLFYIVLIPS